MTRERETPDEQGRASSDAALGPLVALLRNPVMKWLARLALTGIIALSGTMVTYLAWNVLQDANLRSDLMVLRSRQDQLMRDMETLHTRVDMLDRLGTADMAGWRDSFARQLDTLTRRMGDLERHHPAAFPSTHLRPSQAPSIMIDLKRWRDETPPSRTNAGQQNAS